MTAQGQKRRLGRGSAAAGIPPIATKLIRTLNVVLGQERIYATQQRGSLFYHLIGAA